MYINIYVWEFPAYRIFTIKWKIRLFRNVEHVIYKSRATREHNLNLIYVRCINTFVYCYHNYMEKTTEETTSMYEESY